MGNILDVYSNLRIGERNEITAPFIGRGNIWINNTYVPEAQIDVQKLARKIMIDAIMATAPGQLSILGFDADLSGLFAPLAVLSSGDGSPLKMIDSYSDFTQHLGFLRRQIQDIQNVVQGRCNSLLEFREKMGMPIEGFQLVVLSLNMGMIDSEVRTELSTLLKSAPSAGISFLIISPTYMPFRRADGSDYELTVDSFSPNFTVLEADGETVFEEDGARASFRPYPAETMIRICEDYMMQLRSAQLPVVRFQELHDLNDYWTETSTDGLTFSVGKYGINDMNITIGDEVNQRHNIVITGAVGQGKSNLISVIIHSMCMRYSPRELQLYLLDFKEGVTFKAFSDIGHQPYLPHAKVLGLESDADFGIVVLETLFEEYQKRMKVMKEYNARNLRDLRIKHPELEMPRIVAVIDEFQMMFGDDNDTATGLMVAELLEKSVRLFRAAGIHFILASQSLSGCQPLMHKYESIFGQIPIRIGLKNSESESRKLLGMNNPAAAFLRPREALVNLDYGEPSQNRKTIVAFADEEVLAPVRREWWQQAKERYAAPYVFESLRRIYISDAADAIRRDKGFKAPSAYIGEKISINGECVSIPLISEPGRNIAVFGSSEADCRTGSGILQSIAISLAIQNRAGKARFLFCDFDREGDLYDKSWPRFAEIMRQLGHSLECIEPAQFMDCIQTLERAEKSDVNTYVFAEMLDKWKYESDTFDEEVPLKKLIESGPSKNIHLIGWWVKEMAFKKQTSGVYGASESFNTKVFLRIDQRSVESLTENAFVKWSPMPNRILVTDSVEYTKPIICIPYSPPDCEGE